MPDHLIALGLGFILDVMFGDPEWLTHPVCFIGKWIRFAEKKFRAVGGNLRVSAVFLTLSTVFLTMGAAVVILKGLSMFGKLPLLIGMTVLDWLGLAMHSMVKEAEEVRRVLKEEGVEAGRIQVARIVGRDTQNLTDGEIIRAAVETVAENTTDGVISPMLYAAIGGPVLLWGFKASSTLDSMVGYLDERYRDIGWSSAKLDDILNFIPARLTAVLMCIAACLCGLDGRNAFRIVRRDHANHLSPNCAWSESAAAGALHIQLGGTHEYFGKTVVKPTIGDPDRPETMEDISKTNCLLCISSVLMLVIMMSLGMCLC